MAIFSVDGDDDGEGPSTGPGPGPSPKRQRLLLCFESQTQTPSPPPQPTIGEGNDAAPAQTQTPRSTFVAGNCSQGSREPVGSSGNGSITLTLEDPDVLDCSICFEPLCAPIFQCENGHIACSSCCTKVRNKCHLCSLPIGYNRCRAIEKLLESVRVSCCNSEYGCNETLSYSKRGEHEKTCLHAPCPCPLEDCTFVGSFKLLYGHFTCEHSAAPRRFLYDSQFSIIMQATDKCVVLQEMLGGTLFIITNGIQPLGNVVSISCIGHSASKERFKYDITAKMQETSLNLVASMKMTEGRGEEPLESGFLVIPTGFSASTGQLALDICIWRDDGRPKQTRKVSSHARKILNGC